MHTNSYLERYVGARALSPPEIRVLGCLLEKQRTTPDAYPLSLNSLRLACNQSTNREPVLAYEAGEVQEALHRLERRGFVRLASGRGSRAPKYRHLLADALPMDIGEQSIVCVLMLRGAQTPGELKQRCERMHAFADLDSVLRTLGALIERGLVQRLDRRPGQKEERYLQLLAAEREGEPPPEPGPAAASPKPDAAPAPPAGVQGTPALSMLLERVERLEREVAALRGGAGREEGGVP